LRWATLAASAVGAPHERKRWFCLAIKRGFSLAKLQRSIDAEGLDAQAVASWAPETEPPRMTLALENMHAHKTRCGMLGNAVVPDCVRSAFVHLVKLVEWGRVVKAKPVAHEKEEDASEGEGAAAEETEPALPPAMHMPTHGYTKNKKIYKMVSVARPAAHHIKVLCFDPDAYKTTKPPSIQLKSGRLTEPKMSRFWSTPRHGMLGACNYLTARSVRDLPTQVRFEKNTPDELREGSINPAFVEWIMGYPPNWTMA